MGSDEDAFIMSLAENIARRQRRPLELLAGIQQLQEQGYAPKAIAEKTGLTQSYVQGILTLLHHSEERLVIAVEKGQIPLMACKRRNLADPLAQCDPSAPSTGEAWTAAQPVGREFDAPGSDAKTPLERLRGTVLRYENPTDPV